MTGLILLGTDTGVGKTTLACGLLHLAHLRALSLIPYKPAETGCDPHPEDAARLLHASGITDLTVADICPYPLRKPVAPSVAARLEGRLIEKAVLLERAAALSRGGRPLLVEGAGGLLTPYGPGLDGATLAALLDLEVLLVSANRLGTINQTRLTLEALDRRGLRCRGFVLVDVGPIRGPDSDTNASEIQAATGAAHLGVLPFVTASTPGNLASAVRENLDLSLILDGALQAPP